MDRITLYQEYRLVERSESEVNGAWKGAHLLLFFLTFVFGSFCTFCFHMLMYMFNDQCVLFPKLLSLNSLRQKVIYEFIPEDKELADILPVDFLGTRWSDKSLCYLPTYMPLVSGIFGLVWTTMFLMCSSGTRTLTGLQRPWRVIQPVLVFSLVMGSLCIYTSVITQKGLEEMCLKLGEFTGSSSCSYTINVVTLVYERRIRGVYQATRLTITSAWLHTICWLLSALLALARVLFAVDFQLVRVDVDLIGNIDRMLDDYEQQMQTISHNVGKYNERSTESAKPVENNSDLKVHFTDTSRSRVSQDVEKFKHQGEILYVGALPRHTSELALVNEELDKLARIQSYKSVPKEKRFIVKMIYELLETMELPESPPPGSTSSTLSFSELESGSLIRTFGQENIGTKKTSHPVANVKDAQLAALEIKRKLHGRQVYTGDQNKSEYIQSASNLQDELTYESSMNITAEMRHVLKDQFNKDFPDSKRAEKKSNLKDSANQTDKKNKKDRKVKITESIDDDDISESSNDSTEDKQTQTGPKEKQD